MTISFKRGTFATNDVTSTSAFINFSSNNGGNLLVASVGYFDPANTITVTAVTDTIGNTWRVANVKARNATQQFAIYTYYAYGSKPTGAANRVTFELSASATFRRLAVEEWTSSNGPWVSDPLDKVTSATGAGTALSAGPVTPASDGQLVYGWAATGAGTINRTGSPWTLREPSTPISGVGAVDQVQSALAAVSIVATSSVSDQWVIQGATFADTPPTLPSGSTLARLRPSTAASTGRARYLMAGGDFINDEDLLPAIRPSEGMLARVLADFWWGGQPDPVQIPYLWLVDPVTWLEDAALNVAQISGTATASATDANSVAAFGETTFTATLATAVPADAPALANWVKTYYATQDAEVPRVRFGLLRFVLNFRSPSEMRTLLGVRRGMRISITDTPDTWPAGASEQVVEGEHNSSDANPGGRYLEWITSPVIGVQPGTPGPWFRLNSSMLGGDDALLF